MGRDIERGPELAKAHAARLAWQRKDPEQKAAAYRAVAKSRADRVKPNYTTAYVLPFLQSSDTFYYECRGLDDTQPTNGQGVINMARRLAVLDSRIVFEAPAAPKEGAAAPPVNTNTRRYRFAKITVKARRGEGNENAKSRITNRIYTRYHTDNASSPFGRAKADANFMAACQSIRNNTVAKTFEDTKGQTIGFTAERG